MPELPEVETVRLGLSRLIVGREIVDVSTDWPKSFPNSKHDVGNFLVHSKVLDVRRRAKVLIIDLSSKYSLVIHLKMTGQLVFVSEKKELRSQGSDLVTKHSKIQDPRSKILRWGAGHPNDSLVGKLPDKSTRVIFTFSDNSHLYFNDQRKFGWVRLMPTLEVENIDFMKKVGPEPLEENFTPELFVNQLTRRKNSAIKAVLLDQTVLAGIGNIYADESLWAAQLHPETKVANITKAKLYTLRSEIIKILLFSLEKGGSTDRNYLNAEGKKGSYIEFARVFRREGKPCYRCGTEKVKIRVAGRGTHICIKCQKRSK